MKTISKKEIQNTISTSLTNVVNDLNIKTPSKKTSKLIKQVTKKFSSELKQELKKQLKKMEKASKKSVNGKAVPKVLSA
ncbi:MAG TPA: hypothetical protein VGD65_25025 [Chryseosolibacter sp.]